MTYAVIRLGGKQFKVSVGDIIEIERQPGNKAEVLLFSDNGNLAIGEPVLEDHGVVLSLIKDKRADKVRVARFKSKSRYRKVKGHRQPMSVFKVEKIGKGVKAGTKAKKPVVKEEKPVEEEKVEQKVEKKEEKKEKPAKTTSKKAETKVKETPKKKSKPKKEEK